MGFRDEIIKDRRKIAPYIHFSQALNPAGEWAGPADRLYGAAEDGTGPLAIKGHVLTFGSFSRSVASAIFSLEIPGTSSQLVDEDLDWRQYANEPYDTLMRKWLHFLLRVHDDEDIAHDATVALGQIQTIGYPPARKVQLTTSVAPPDLMGAKIPRRTITQDDWPNAPAESIGRPVPIIYGCMTNAVVAICPPEEESTPEEEEEAPMMMSFMAMAPVRKKPPARHVRTDVRVIEWR